MDICFLILNGYFLLRASQVVPVIETLPDSAGDTRDTVSIPGLERSPGEGNDNSLQYSCLENAMARGAWRATVHGVAELDTAEAT